jgi:diguanylate cyclase (GGDEF)-like protein/PAS domain S-box-containing protein
MTRVLAVEDSPTQAERLRADLVSGGFAVTMARDGQEALAFLETDQFDLVLTDIVMPGMDGYELCRTVKARSTTDALPVVLLTSLRDPLDVVKGLEAGADNFLRKPYRAEQLTERLRTTIRNRELRRGSRVQMGVKLSLLDREFEITAERPQILDLLVSTFEELVVSIRDVRTREAELTQLHAEVERQLEATQIERNRLRAVLDFVPVPVVVMDRDGTITHLSRVGERVFEATADDLQASGPRPIHYVDSEGKEVPRHELPLQRAAAEGESIEMGSAFDLLLVRKDGRRTPVVLNASPVFDDAGRSAGSVATAVLLGAIAEHDPITGLPNRRAFGERLAGALETRRTSAAVLLIGVDNLDTASGRLVNHMDGETILAEVGRAVADAVRDCQDVDPHTDVMAASLGGGQFGIFQIGHADGLSALRIADCVHRSLAAISGDFAGPQISASIGAVIAEEAADASQLLTAAGVALKRARAAGGDRVELFDPAASAAALDRLQLEMDLRDAIAKREVSLFYQPQVDLMTREVIGFEALARWHHPTRGPISPAVFVPIAEESDLILALGQHVLASACDQLRLWAESGLLLEDQSISVNLSTVQLRPELVGEVVDLLRRTGVRPGQLMLEITETAAMKDPEVTIDIIQRLKAIGVRFSLDDFGTGYSSLAYLSRIDFDTIKLDRTFVSGISDDGVDATIAQSVIALGHSLGVQVIAEGVEEEDQVAILQSYGCDQAQGFLFHRPLPTQDAEQLLARSAALT